MLRENSFAVTSVRLQPERGQSVISTGPYTVVRHPMYAVAIASPCPSLLQTLTRSVNSAVFGPDLILGPEAR